MSILTKLNPAQPQGSEATRAICKRTWYMTPSGSRSLITSLHTSQIAIFRGRQRNMNFENGTRRWERELTTRREWWWWVARGGRDGGGRSGGQRGARPFPPRGIRHETTRAESPAEAAPQTAGLAAPATASGAPALAVAATIAPPAPPRGSLPCTARITSIPRATPATPRGPAASRVRDWSNKRCFGGGDDGGHFRADDRRREGVKRTIRVLKDGRLQ